MRSCQRPKCRYSISNGRRCRCRLLAQYRCWQWQRGIHSDWHEVAFSDMQGAHNDLSSAWLGMVSHTMHSLCPLRQGAHNDLSAVGDGHACALVGASIFASFWGKVTFGRHGAVRNRSPIDYVGTMRRLGNRRSISWRFVAGC